MAANFLPSAPATAILNSTARQHPVNVSMLGEPLCKEWDVQPTHCVAIYGSYFAIYFLSFVSIYWRVKEANNSCIRCMIISINVIFLFLVSLPLVLIYSN